MSLPPLPDIAFAELDPAEVERGIITTCERLLDKTLFPGDPLRLFLESLAYLISMQNAAIDLAGKQQLLAYAQGAHLDHLGTLVATPRLPAAPAITSIRFALAEPLPWAALIPQGSRVTTGNGGLIFATDGTAAIAAGELSIDVAATCTEAGQKGNGWRFRWGTVMEVFSDANTTERQEWMVGQGGDCRPAGGQPDVSARPQKFGKRRSARRRWPGSRPFRPASGSWPGVKCI
jgi:uncharacterized phage protein gp47/JayE